MFRILVWHKVNLYNDWVFDKQLQRVYNQSWEYDSRFAIPGIYGIINFLHWNIYRSRRIHYAHGHYYLLKSVLILFCPLVTGLRIGLFSSVSSSKFRRLHKFLWDRDSAADIATHYGLNGPGIESRWGGAEIFCTRPDRPWSPPNLLYNGYRIFAGCKAAGAWHWPPIPI